MKRLAAALIAASILAQASHAQSCAPRSIKWSEAGATHVTELQARVREGCPMLRQSVTFESGGTPLEAVGRDCDCDLVIDGEEARFSAPADNVARTMLAACRDNRAFAREKRAERAGAGPAGADF